MKVIQTRTPESVAVDFDTIPSYQSDAMCRTLIGCISRLFEDPAVMADYKRWQQERQQKADKKLATIAPGFHNTRQLEKDRWTTAGQTGEQPKRNQETTMKGCAKNGMDSSTSTTQRPPQATGGG